MGSSFPFRCRRWPLACEESRAWEWTSVCGLTCRSSRPDMLRDVTVHYPGEWHAAWCGHLAPGGAGALAATEGSLCRAVPGFDAVLTEKITKALDLLGQGWKVRVRGCPLLLTGGPLAEQLPFPVAQPCGGLEVLCVYGGFFVAARPARFPDRGRGRPARCRRDVRGPSGATPSS